MFPPFTTRPTFRRLRPQPRLRAPRRDGHRARVAAAAARRGRDCLGHAGAGKEKIFPLIFFLKIFFLGSVKRVLHVMSSHMFAPQWPQFDGTSSFPKSPLRAKARSSAKSVAPGWLDRPLVTQFFAFRVR